MISFQSKSVARVTSALLTAASAVALAATMPSLAHAAEAGAQELEEVVVTGSRIVRDGYDAPTPLTVIGTEDLAQTATSNIADTLNTMPVFSGSLTPASGVSVPSQGTGGINSLELRNLGEARTLILMDGQRSVSALANGIVDINNFPQQLIQRVDVVTGGASAVYGSDAVAGVVNLILDREFTGVKGELSGGVTTYGDDRAWKIALASGFPFANGRGHVLMSGEWVNKDGILIGTGKRKWGKSGIGRITNPAYGTGPGQSRSVPEFITVDNAGLSQGAPGGIITRCAGPGVPPGPATTSCPLKGIAFGDFGVPYNFNYGITTPNDLYMAGGDWRSQLTDETGSLDPSEGRQNAFFRAAYDVTDNTNVYVQLSWGNTETFGLSLPHYEAGAGPTVLSGNPFIPAAVQAQMTALGITSFQLGTMNADMPPMTVGTVRTANRYVAGADGNFDAFDTSWTWNAYFQYGKSRGSFNTASNEDKAKYALARDAIRHPVTGAIVCRVNGDADPTNDTHCVPWNLMGTNVNDAMAREYILGTVAHSNLSTSQSVFAGSVTGEPFNSWAGPVSVALSAEHRKDTALLVSGPLEQASRFRAGNHQPLDASNSVTEGAVEFVVPLANDTSFADAWDLSLAFRGTDYKTSGYVSTWKVGSTYAPIPDIRIRATRSRDIRAPNISELYQLQDTGLGTSFDQVTNSSPTYDRRQVGNLNLRPEKADTTDIGVVVTPSFLPGFTASVDYWNIDIKDAITLISAPQTIQLCFDGRTELCPGVIRNSQNVITLVRFGSANFAVETARGVDFEATYAIPGATFSDAIPGDFRLHVAGTHYIKSYLNDGLSLPNDRAGATELPKWIWNASVAYSLDAFNVSFSARGFSSTVQDNDFIACTTGCPVSTANNATFDTLYQPGGVYFDASTSYRMEIGGTEVETFLNIRNLLNKDPGIFPRRAGADFSYLGERSSGRGDTLGRVFRAGLRFKM